MNLLNTLVLGLVDWHKWFWYDKTERLNLLPLPPAI